MVCACAEYYFNIVAFQEPEAHPAAEVKKRSGRRNRRTRRRYADAMRKLKIVREIQEQEQQIALSSSALPLQSAITSALP